MAARAESQSDTLKARFEVIEAKLYDEHRKLLLASGEKVTEKMVENAVKMDVRWFKGKNTVIEAGSIAAINKQLVESIKDRRDMIIQLGADRRDEFKGQARIMAADAERDSLKDRAAKAAAGALRERNAA
jgi:predicted dinucleotide-utilizing enzyme